MCTHSHTCTNIDTQYIHEHENHTNIDKEYIHAHEIKHPKNPQNIYTKHYFRRLPKVIVTSVIRLPPIVTQ